MERRIEIQNLLTMGSNRMRVADLSRHFGVSAVTIRKDLRVMEAKGVLVRGYGVASNVAGTARYSLQRDIRIHEDLKRRIADKAATLVSDREVVMLGPGSTCCLLGQQLCRMQSLILVTNAICFEPYLMPANDVRVLYLGGEYNTDNGSTIGSFAIDALRQLSIDCFFIGATGVTTQAGLTSNNFADAMVVRTMMERSKQVVLITDHTKFGRVSMLKIADFDAVDMVITDKELDEKYVQELNTRGVHLALV